jgi:hypothetical protein
MVHWKRFFCHKEAMPLFRLRLDANNFFADDSQRC